MDTQCTALASLRGTPKRNDYSNKNTLMKTDAADRRGERRFIKNTTGSIAKMKEPFARQNTFSSLAAAGWPSSTSLSTLRNSSLFPTTRSSSESARTFSSSPFS
uniref:Uncharacterized protein n=1 Tax=Corethron hystrix TaxID=216773 RepID=A0A7S1BCA9_9STRA